MLPEPSIDDVRALGAAGWARLGIVAAVMDGGGRIMMLEHKASDKTPDGALGPLAETTQFTHTETGIVIESTAHTLARAIKEELAIADPNDFELYAKKIGAWTLNNWPVGIGHNGQRALAICPVVHISRRSRRELIDTFAGTEEIRAITFMEPHDIVTHALTRSGTSEWVNDIMASGLADSYNRQLSRVALPSPQPLANAMDAKIVTMDYA
jgi:hypothetical protein